jgi:hypothetical protein
MLARFIWRVKSTMVYFLLGCALAAALPGAANACETEITPDSSAMYIDYDPFAFARSEGQLAFTVTNKSEQDCAVEIVLMDAAQLSTAKVKIANSGILVVFSARSGDALLHPSAIPGVWRLNLAHGRSTGVVISGLVMKDAVPSAGRHEAELTVGIRGDGNASVPVSSLPLRVILFAQPRAQMNIVGTAGTFGKGPSVAQVDFGEIASNSNRRVFLQVRANTTARLSVDSANGGRLLREGGVNGEVGVVYSVQLSEAQVDLTKHWELIFEPPRSLAGTSLPLDLTIGTVSAERAGIYSDILTIELSAI